MSIDIIKSIRETEARAEQIKKQSHEDARRIISEAEKKAAQLLEESILIAEDEGRKVVKAAEDSASAEASEIMRDMEKECEAIKKHAMEKIDIAVKLIVERIVEACGNS